MPKLIDTVRITTTDSAVWRTCTACGLLAALPPDVEHCRHCRPAVGPAAAATVQGGARR
jgi:hypothetical protein